MLLTVNADAGSAEREDMEVALGVLRGAGHVELAETSSPEDLDDVLRSLGDRQLILAGGDGSLHLAIARLRELGRLQDTPIGLIPMGTGNDFARGVGVPLEPEAAAEACLDGRTRELDLILDDSGGVVVNAAHAGLGAAAAERSDDLKEHLGPLAYPLGALLAGTTEAEYDLEVTVDRRPVHDGATLMVAVLNGSCIGGGAQLCADARADDGLLDVLVITAVTRAARMAFGAALKRGTHIDRDDVEHVRGREVTIAGEAVTHDVDGELYASVSDRTYTVVERCWQLVVPAWPTVGSVKLLVEDDEAYFATGEQWEAASPATP